MRSALCVPRPYSGYRSLCGHPHRTQCSGPFTLHFTLHFSLFTFRQEVSPCGLRDLTVGVRTPHSRMGRRFAAAELREMSPCGLRAQSMPVRERESVALWAKSGALRVPFTFHSSLFAKKCRPAGFSFIGGARAPTLTCGDGGSVALRAGSGERKQRARPCKIACVVQALHFGRRDVADRYRIRDAVIVRFADIRNTRTCSLLPALRRRCEYFVILRPPMIIREIPYFYDSPERVY
jgi:hypothetical protein